MATEASTPRRKLSAILMVDVSGFSRMMGRDEEGTTALIRDFHTRTQSLVEAHEGWVVDTAGDSVFGEFDSVVNAVRCAQAIQQTQATVNATRLPGERIETRIGVHLGDVIVQDAHVYGDGVNIAARLQAVAAPGSICVSEAVYQQVYTKCDLAFEDLGVYRLLFHVTDPAELRGYVDQVLGPLIDYDQRHHADFVQTLARFLAHNGNLQATARELSLHVNSVTYRMQRIQSIAGLDLEEAEDRLLAQVALKILSGVAID